LKQTNHNYNCIIVGAGPAGLFAALELLKSNVQDILILEKGNSLGQRSRTETLCGVGGSGTFSDGKLHFSLNLSQERLLDFCTREQAQSLIDYVEQIFLNYGVTAPVTPRDISEVNRLVKQCREYNIQLYNRRCRHVGSDALPGIIQNIVNDLLKHNVEIVTNTTANHFIQTTSGIDVLTDCQTYHAKTVLVAPGRVGTKWLQIKAEELKIKYDYQMVEVGIRFEFPASVMEDHSKILYENIYTLQTPSFDDPIRTLCPCPNGYVSVENYGDYVCVNGHSNSKNESPNSNFALLQEITLTEPVENTTDYAISIARLATTIGGGKPIIQRLSDLRKNRRSNTERIRKSIIIPSLVDCTPGDISMALPYRVVHNLLEALEILNHVLPGINAGSNFLYAPEIKLRGSKIQTNRHLETKINRLFVAGDGAGVSGNIVGAAATGILAARGIAAKLG